MRRTRQDLNNDRPVPRTGGRSPSTTGRACGGRESGPGLNCKPETKTNSHWPLSQKKTSHCPAAMEKGQKKIIRPCQSAVNNDQKVSRANTSSRNMGKDRGKSLNVAHNIKKNWSKKIDNGGSNENLPMFKLNLEETWQNSDGFCRRSTFGDNITKGNKTIMMIGATGAGKTTLINSMINYILGVQWKDDFRFVLIDEGNQKSQAESQTSEITAYQINYMDGFRVPYSLTIVDTPGFGDTRGISHDQKITKQIHEFFSARGGIDCIDAVCFVVQASLARLTHTQKYVFDSILSILFRALPAPPKLGLRALPAPPKLALRALPAPPKLGLRALPAPLKFRSLSAVPQLLALPAPFLRQAPPWPPTLPAPPWPPTLPAPPWPPTLPAPPWPPALPAPPWPPALPAPPWPPALPAPPWPPALPAAPRPPALPAPPWHPGLPLSPGPLPLHGPGPPSLPLIHLRSASLRDCSWSVWNPLLKGGVLSQSSAGVPRRATR